MPLSVCQVVQSGCVAMWAARLGLFLFYRVMKDGHDRRFNRVRENPKRFFFFWTMQGLVCYVTMAAVWQQLNKTFHECLVMCE